MALHDRWQTILRRGSLAMVALLASAAGTVLAETYKYVDERGRVQYGDRVPAEAVNRGMVELNKQGMPKKVIEPAPTAEQRKAAEEKLEKQKQAEREAARRHAVEVALLQSYTSEQDIDVARRRNLAIVGAAILTAEARIAALEKRMAALEKERQFYATKPLPDGLKREIVTVAAEIPKQYELIQAKKQEALAIQTRYTEQMERYREAKSQIVGDAPPTITRASSSAGR